MQLTFTTATLPTRLEMNRDELARELAQKNGECGFIQSGMICTLDKGHTGGHRGIKIERYVPLNRK